MATDSGRIRCVFVVDDDPALLRVVKRTIERSGHEVRDFASPVEMLATLETAEAIPDLILTDLHMPQVNGLELLERAKRLHPDLPVIFMTGAATVDTAVRAMKLGAYDYLVKPFEPLELITASVNRALEYRGLREQNRSLARALQVSQRFEQVVGSDGSLREVFALIDGIADVDLSVLILGESGTGKELIAKAIHKSSRRRDRTLVAINCGALSESVLESELFGHARGAFTGASDARRGLFEEASGGTLFLDEVGELTPATQVKLLRVLQEGEVRPVGANTSRKVDVRVIAATHRDLTAQVGEGKFREDLYYRLNVVSLELPPLRERSGDIAQLTQHLIAKHAARMQRHVSGIDDEALQVLSRYRWPGNVRELENAIARAVALSKTDTITLDLLPPHIRAPAAEIATGVSFELPLADARQAFEQEYLKRALDAGGSIAAAARIAGLDPSNFRRLLKRHDLRSP